MGIEQKDYEKTEYWKLVQEFVDELRTAKYWFVPDGKPNKEWVLFEQLTLDAAWNAAWNAAQNATRDAVQDAARSAAWNATQNATQNAARSAARNAAWDAAWDAAWNATQNAVQNAVRNAAWDAAQNATRDAVLFARMIVCLDLPMKTKHLCHVNDRMEVWRKGYCLLCDVNGKLYVYAATNKTEKVKR